MGGNTSTVDTGVNNPVTTEQIAAKLKSLGSLTFTLVPLPILSGTKTFPASGPINPDTGAPMYGGSFPFTTTMRLAGKWLKLFGHNPGQYTDTKTDGKYLLVSAQKPLVCR